MKAKLLTLMLGVPLAALGVRWGAVPHAAKWMGAIAAGLFVTGQYVVRFEDYPGGRELVGHIASRWK